MSERMSLVEWLVVAAIGATLAVPGCNLVGGVAGRNFANPDKYVATITEKAVRRQWSDDQYLVFTKLADGEVRVFQNEGAWLAGKFASSDLYAKLEVGKTYEFKTTGWRVPLFSWYENIHTAREVTPANNSLQQ